MRSTAWCESRILIQIPRYFIFVHYFVYLFLWTVIYLDFTIDWDDLNSIYDQHTKTVMTHLYYCSLAISITLKHFTKCPFSNLFDIFYSFRSYQLCQRDWLLLIQLFQCLFPFSCELNFIEACRQETFFMVLLKLSQPCLLLQNGKKWPSIDFEIIT